MNLVRFFADLKTLSVPMSGQRIYAVFTNRTEESEENQGYSWMLETTHAPITEDSEGTENFTLAASNNFNLLSPMGRRSWTATVSQYEDKLYDLAEMANFYKEMKDGGKNFISLLPLTLEEAAVLSANSRLLYNTAQKFLRRSFGG